MTRRTVQLGLLLGVLLAAWFLVFDAGWQAEEYLGSSPTNLEERDGSVPRLAPGATRRLTVVDTAQAKALLAALKGKSLKEQRRVFVRLFSGPVSYFDRPVPYHEPLAKYLIEILSQKEHGGLWNWGGLSCLIGMGQPVAALLEPHVGGKDIVLHRMAIAVLLALQEQGAEVSLPPLLTLLESPDRYVRQCAWGVLSRGVPYDEAIAQRMLAHMQRDPEPHGWSPGTALAQMGPRGVALLLGELHVADSHRRLAALRAIARAPVDEIRGLLPRLTRAMEDPDPDVREWAIRVLWRLEGDCVACLPALLKTAQEEDFGIVQASLSVFMEMGPAAAEAVPLLLKRLHDDDPRLSGSAASALGAIRARPAEVLPALASAVREDASEAAAAAIGQFEREGWPYAVALLRDEDDDVRYSALTAFQAMGEAAAPIVPELLPLIRGDDYTLALYAIETAGVIGPRAKAAIPVILERLAWGDDDLPATKAGPALAHLGPAVEEPLRRALRSADYVTRRQAVQAMAYFHGRSQFAFDELEALLEDKDATLRLHALHAAAAALNPPPMLEPRAPVPQEETVFRVDPGVRKRLRSLLKGASEDKDEQVRRSAENYLRRVDQPQQGS